MAKALKKKRGRIYVEAQKTGRTKITLYDYDQNKFAEKAVIRVERCFPLKERPIDM